MINAFFTWLISLIFSIIIHVLDIIFGLIGSVIVLPNFLDYSNYIQSFWDLCFEGVGFVRSSFLIGSFELNIIYTILIIKLTYKPLISMIKMFIHWYDKLKV